MLTVRGDGKKPREWLADVEVSSRSTMIKDERYCSQCWWCEEENVDETSSLANAIGSVNYLGVIVALVKCLILFHIGVSGLWGTDEVHSMCTMNIDGAIKISDVKGLVFFKSK